MNNLKHSLTTMNRQKDIAVILETQLLSAAHVNEVVNKATKMAKLSREHLEIKCILIICYRI